LPKHQRPWEISRQANQYLIERSLKFHVILIEIPIRLVMARPLGAKNKRTLLREARLREAAMEAQRQLASLDNEATRFDSLWVMEEAMSYFFRRAMMESGRIGIAGSQPDLGEAVGNFTGNSKHVRDDLLQAVAIAT
jgi:hypothetical protein